MTTTEKKAPAQAKKTTRKAPARKVAAAQKAAPQKVEPVEAVAVVTPAPEAEIEKAVPAPEAVETQVEADTTAFEAKIELLSSQIQEGYNEMFEFSKEQMEKFFKFEGVDTFKAVEDAMAFSKENVDAFVKSSSIAAKGVQDVASLLAEMTRTSVEENAAASKKVFECKTPQEFAELQTQLLKSGYEKFVENANRISEASNKIAQEAAKPLQARVEAGVEKVKTAAA